MKFRSALCFDDVLLIPQKSDISSRQDICIATNISDKNFRLPIASSPMDTVTEVEMALALYKSGGLGIVHRYNSIQEQCKMIQAIASEMEEESSDNIGKISAAVGVGEDFLPRTRALFSSGVRVLCIDVAHGHHKLMERALKSAKDTFGSSLCIMAGNIATPDAFKDLSSWGADSIRIGIGGGSICSTRVQTGHGMPTLQSVLDCRDVADASIIADGGIKTAGDIVKALAAGADMVMLGSMLSGTKEAPGEVFQSADNKQYKVYRGMASPEAQIAWRGEARSLEGISTTVPYKGEVAEILRNLHKNVKSGLSYTGACSLAELRAKARFIQQTQSGLSESQTHILTK